MPDDAISLLCAATIAGLTEFVSEYDANVALASDDYFGGLADRYEIIITFTDARYNTITTMYLPVGEHAPMFW